MQPDNNLRNGMQRQGVRAHRRHARSTETPAVNLQEHMRLLPGALTRRVAGGLSVNGGGAAAIGQQPRMQGKIAAAGTGHACGSGHAVGHQVAHAGGPSAGAAGHQTAYGMAMGGPGLQPAQICSPADTCTAASADMVVSEADGGVPGAAHPDSSLRRHLAAQSEQHGKRPAGELYAGMQDVPLIPDVSAGAFHSAPPGVVAGTSHTATAYL